MSGEVLLRIAGDADRYRQELEKIPGFTATQAKKASDAWARSQNIAAAQVAAGIKKSGEDTAKAWGEIGKKLASMAGGPFAQIGELVGGIGPAASSASAGMSGIAVAGGAVAGVAVGIAAVTAAAFKLAGAAAEAEQRLEAAGRAAEIPPLARQGIEDYTAATADLSLAWDRFVATVGGATGSVLAPVLTWVTEATEGYVDLIAEVYNAESAFEAFTTAAGAGIRTWGALATGGLSEVALGYMGYGDAVEDTGKRVVATLETETAATEKELAAQEAARTQAARQAERELEERRRTAARAAEEQRREAVAAEKKRAEELKKIQDEELADALAADSRYYEEKAAIQADANARMAGYAQAALEIDAERAVAGLQALQADVDALLADVEASAQAQQDAIAASWDVMGDTIGAVSDLSMLAYESIANSGEKLTKAQKKQAREWAAMSKATAIVVATLSAIEGVAKAAASAPPPLNVPAIISATALGAVQVAKAVSTKLPSLFAGGRDRGDGEGMALLHKGESVLNARATDAIVRALNQGLSPLGRMAGAGGPMADVYLDGRAVGVAMRRAERAGRWAGGPPPGYVRRGR